jgi:peptidoglycan hydrolase CwlO-like protein
MNNLRKGAAAFVAAAALSVGGVTLAEAANAQKPAKPAPCATQQAHLTKAQAKLDALTKKFAAESAKVKKDQRAVAATKGSAKAQAKKALRTVKAERAQVVKAKKAQQQRVAHDTKALSSCIAANSPAPSGSATPTPSPTA